MLATVFFSHGTPMLLAGDEFGRTQRGNNNAYCQDNEISWLDWHRPRRHEGEALTDFVARLIRIRHGNPVLRCRHFLHGKDEPPRVFSTSHGSTARRDHTAESWNNPEEAAFCCAACLARRRRHRHVLTLFLNPREPIEYLRSAAAGRSDTSSSIAPRPTDRARTSKGPNYGGRTQRRADHECTAGAAS